MELGRWEGHVLEVVDCCWQLCKIKEYMAFEYFYHTGLIIIMPGMALPPACENQEDTQDRDESPKKEKAAVTRHLSS